MKQCYWARPGFLVEGREGFQRRMRCRLLSSSFPDIGCITISKPQDRFPKDRFRVNNPP